MILLRSLFFYAGLIVATVIFTLLGIVFMPLNFPFRYRIISKWSVFNLWWLKITCGLDFQVHGKENIPDSVGIIMCKHQSAWETLALQTIFPAQVWVLKRELLWIPIYGWGLATMQPISIDRSSGMRALKQIVKQGITRLNNGLWIVIFPEGTRTAPGEKRKYQSGGGLLAVKSQHPIVPVAHNAGSFWPRNSLTKRPGTIHMVVGSAIYADDKSAEDVTKEVEDWIESTMVELLTKN